MTVRKLTIAYLVRPAEGGIKSHLLAVLDGLDRARFTPVLICPPDCSLATEAAAAGHQVMPLDIAGEINLPRDLRAARQLRGILTRLQPDILHIHSAKAGLVGRLAVLLPPRPRVVLTVHSFVFDERMGARKRALVALAERWLAGVTDVTIAVSAALKDELVAQMRLQPARIRVIYHGVPFLDAPETVADTAPCIGTVARLAPQKGLDILLRAAALVVARAPDTRVSIIGDGPLRPELEALAAELGIADRVEFLGFREDAVARMRAISVFVLSSTRETFGLTLVEALSQRVPVVATRVGGIPEVVEDGVTGLLVAPNDPAALADGICRLLTDRAMAHRLADAGNAAVRARFSSARMIAELEALYQELIETP